ncbi:MAG TPA: septum formation initiator family protein [Candidatus Binatia bacterium]|nr:septum formation initiator family protein [Candidatus Binatia bacterium]
MDLQSFFKSKFATGILLAVFGVVAVVTFELYWQKREVDSEIRRLQGQADSLEKDNQQLSDLIKYLGTQEYQEKEAREKLNLKREGEEVVVLPEDDDLGQVAQANIDNTSNPKKWFNYFFQ